MSPHPKFRFFLLRGNLGQQKGIFPVFREFPGPGASLTGTSELPALQTGRGPRSPISLLGTGPQNPHGILPSPAALWARGAPGTPKSPRGCPRGCGGPVLLSPVSPAPCHGCGDRSPFPNPNSHLNPPKMQPQTKSQIPREKEESALPEPGAGAAEVSFHF